MNLVILEGRLGKDPELTYTQAGNARCVFSLATSEKYKDKNTGEWAEKTEWHNIVIWGKQAENAAKYLSKGSRVLIENGKMTTRSWDDQQSGQKRYMTEVDVRRLTYLDGKKDTGQSQGQRSQPGETGEPAHTGGQQSGPPDDDDIPF